MKDLSKLKKDPKREELEKLVDSIIDLLIEKQL